MTKVCDHCGQQMPQADWRGLCVSEFGEVFWRGVKRLTVVPCEARILSALIARGQATHGALELTTQSETGRCIKVIVHNLRAKLRRAAVPVEIQSIRAVGYRLAEIGGEA